MTYEWMGRKERQLLVFDWKRGSSETKQSYQQLILDGLMFKFGFFFFLVVVVPDTVCFGWFKGLMISWHMQNSTLTQMSSLQNKTLEWKLPDINADAKLKAYVKHFFTE